MQFFTTTISGVALVGGLEWRALTGLKSSQSEIAETARDIGATLYVETRSASEVTCGFVPDERRAELPAKPHALAALLAGMPNIAPDCVFVLQEDEVAILVALRDGLPAPGFDGIGPVDEMIEAARHFIQMSPNGAAVYGNCDQLSAANLTLENLVTNSTTLKQSRLISLRKPWIKYAVAGVVVVLAAGGAKYGYDYREHQKKLDAERKAYVNVDAEYASSLKNLFKEMVGAKSGLRQILTTMDAVEIESGGWDLAEVACQKDGCSYFWKNNFGTNKTFSPPANALDVKYSTKGDLIVYQLAFSRTLPKGIAVAKLPTQQEILRDVSGSLQEFKDFGIEQTFEPAMQIFGVPPGMPSAPAHPIKEGTFTVKGPLYAVEALQNLPEQTTLETVRFVLDSDGNLLFNLTGKYYVQ